MQDVAYLQGQTSNSTGSVSTTQQQQQQITTITTTSTSNLSETESTPSLTHATRVSPATVRIGNGCLQQFLFIFCLCKNQTIFASVIFV